MAKIAEVQEVSRGLLKPYERNAKIHSEEQVKKIADSIKEFGFVNPVLIDRDYNIIAGHGRVMAAESLGLDTVPCLYVEGLTDEQRRAYILADNRLGELGEWDMELVNVELMELQNTDFDIELTGFTLNTDGGGEVGVDSEPSFNYKEQYGVIVMCADEADQEAIYTALTGQGYECKVVAT